MAKRRKRKKAVKRKRRNPKRSAAAKARSKKIGTLLRQGYSFKEAWREVR